jgi:hypothetical protein
MTLPLRSCLHTSRLPDCCNRSAAETHTVRLSIGGRTTLAWLSGVERCAHQRREAGVCESETRHLLLVEPRQGIMFAWIAVARLSLPAIDQPDVCTKVVSLDVGEGLAVDDGRDTKLLVKFTLQAASWRFAIPHVAAREIPGIGIPGAPR